MGHNLLMQLSTLRSSKMEFSETEFLIWTIHSDQISYVCFRPSSCVFHPIWALGRGGELLNDLVTNWLTDGAPSLFKVPCR